MQQKRNPYGRKKKVVLRELAVCSAYAVVSVLCNTNDQMENQAMEISSNPCVWCLQSSTARVCLKIVLYDQGSTFLWDRMNSCNEEGKKCLRGSRRDQNQHIILLYILFTELVLFQGIFSLDLLLLTMVGSCGYSKYADLDIRRVQSTSVFLKKFIGNFKTHIVSSDCTKPSRTLLPF